MVAYDWHGERMVLHPLRCMFWEKERALILADLHLGKTGHFRKEGIAVPQQVYQNDLNRLFDAIRLFNPTEIVVVGDLFHSRANREWDWFARWRNDISHIGMTLVLGNHDKIPDELFAKLNMQVEQVWQKGPFCFIHQANAAGLPPGTPRISGHVHPAIQIPTGARQHIRLPCFHFSATTCTLPAFSLFTGNHTIKPKAADSVFAITGQEIIQL